MFLLVSIVLLFGVKRGKSYVHMAAMLLKVLCFESDLALAAKILNSKQI
jgi:hypothetical protein